MSNPSINGGRYPDWITGKYSCWKNAANACPNRCTFCSPLMVACFPIVLAASLSALNSCCRETAFVTRRNILAYASNGIRSHWLVWLTFTTVRMIAERVLYTQGPREVWPPQKKTEISAKIKHAAVVLLNSL